MENRRETLSYVKVCRFCLAQKGLGSLYEKGKSSKTTVTLPLKILSTVSIEVLPSDKKPTYICERCKFFMNLFYEYKHIVRTADEAILQYVQNGTPMGSLNWPSSLTKMFRNMAESETVKTVTEGGATIQVTSHDVSDSDEEDGNVYNVKIGDDEDTKACIKVVTSKDAKPKENSRGKESDTASSEETKEDKQIEEGCYPCDECNCTYPLQQLLNLHKMQKHRNRDVSCTHCDAKFFTKYDLATHQVRHSLDTPFECVACGKKFKRLILLKRHEKVIHPELPQLLCPNCPATFLSIEELEVHQRKHIRLQKPHACPQCDKKFHEKSALKRHIDVIHTKEAVLCCEYCPERFGSITKLARHVRSHISERPYPCKYCDKSFTKSHHYTRHLRLKHREHVRSESLGQLEQYRCEQCEDMFDSQDELIYHSAIHATQNLTCPLCKEKFDDVEAVTAHIRSHVNGVEFMCDFCELIFTSQEKLDTHLMVEHEDEIQNDINDESSMEMEGEDDDDDNGINVKEDGDEMIIEIKKPDIFLVNKDETMSEDKADNTNSEESESEATYTELQTVDTLTILAKETTKATSDKPIATATADNVKIVNKAVESQPPNVLKRVEEVKRKAPLTPDASDAVVVKKIKPIAKTESSNSGGASDKSLRLLEKELQDLKRTNSRNSESSKGSSNNKVVDSLKTKRQQFLTSTPKLRSAEDKKLLINKTQSIEKKQPEKRIVVTKENKEPKETKEVKNNGNTKEEKDNKEKEKDNKEKDKDNNEKDIKEKEKEKITEKDKGKESPKSVVKNGSANDRTNPDEGVRRSTRPSKIKDYAKMIRDRASDDDDTTEDDEDYQEPDKSIESRRGRRPSQASKVATPVKTTPVTSPANPPRKRGRPRKENKEVPTKVKKEDSVEPVEVKKESNQDSTEQKPNDSSNVTHNNQSVVKSPEPTNIPPKNVLVSPTGQTLKKVPVKALPPGVKALPLPPNARPIQSGELCQMQIGKKVVKVQKIVMTKAEVEAMAKKGLVEMKDGTMVLKQGIKLPTADATAVKSTLIGDGETGKECTKKEKAAPTRCDLGDES